MKKLCRSLSTMALALALIATVGLPALAEELAEAEPAGTPEAEAITSDPNAAEGDDSASESLVWEDEGNASSPPDKGPADLIAPPDILPEDSPSPEADPTPTPPPGESAPPQEETGIDEDIPQTEPPQPEATLPPEATQNPEMSETPPPEDDPAADETQAAPYGLVLDESTIVVTTYDELKRALGEDNGFTTIYLGADITAQGGGMPVFSGKPFVILDGSPPSGGWYTFTQYATNSAANAILVNDAGAATTAVTLRNMNIIGKNEYGVVSVGSNPAGVTITLENITYTGPQPLRHRSGRVRVIGGSYTLTTGELAEALHAELGGNLRIEGPASGANAVLWLTGTASTLAILENAAITINTRTYFVYGSIASAAMEAGADLSLTSKRFGFSYAGDSVATFTMAGGASLYIDLSTAESYAALRVSKRFEMAPGSSATILRTGTAGIALRLTAAGAQAVFNNPQRVFLYSAANVPLRFTGAGTLSVTTDAINMWSKTTWPLSSGVETQPSHIWNKAGNEPLTLAGTYLEARNQSLAHNLNADDPATSALTADTFNLEGNQLLAFGAGMLTLDPLTDAATALTGNASPGAALLAGYVLADGTNGQAAGSAGADGAYSLTLEGKLRPGSEAVLLSRAGNLFLRKKATVLDSQAHTLSLRAVPESISFAPASIPGGEAIIPRAEGALRVSVSDTRLEKTPWRIDANLDGPLHGAIGGRESTLANAIVFQTGDGRVLTLNEAPQPIYRQMEAAGDVTDITWRADEGILLRMTPGEIYSGLQYSATIHWTLVDAP